MEMISVHCPTICGITERIAINFHTGSLHQNLCGGYYFGLYQSAKTSTPSQTETQDFNIFVLLFKV
jgi:hypothetical protein